MGTMNKLRENTGVVLWILVIAFGIVWVLQDSGAFDNVGAVQSRDIAVVNGEPISYDEYQNALQQQQQQLRAQTDGNVTPQMQDMVREQTFDALVNNRLLEQEMDRLGISVTDDEVMDMVYGENPDPFIRQQFSDSTGQVNRQLIRNLAQNPEARDSWLQVEQYLRDKRRSEKMTQLIGSTVHVSDEDVLDAYRRRNTSAEVRYVAQRYATVSDDEIEVTEDDLRDYYDEHRDDFRRSRTYTIEYAALSKAPTAEDTAQVIADLEGLRDAFAEAENDSLFLAENASARGYSDAYFSADELDAALADALFPDPTPGEMIGPVIAADAGHLVKVLDTRPADEPVVHARHILMSASDDDAEQQQLAQELKERVEAGEDFAALAREYSDDSGSAARGGDLGWFTRDRMVEPFANAAFNAQPGTIVGPVQTRFGYHVIEVLARADEEVRVADMAYMLRPSQATLNDIEYTLEDLAYYAEESGDFRAEAEEQDLNLQQVEVEAGQDRIPGIGQSAELAAFLEDADEGDISDVFELDDRFIVAHVREVRPEGYRPFEDVKAEIEPRVKLQKKRAVVTQRMEEALAAGDLERLAETLGTTVRTASDVTFETNTVSGLGREPAFAGTVFGLSEGATSGVVAGENAAFVVEVVDVDEPAPITEREREELREELLAERRREVTSQWITSLRDRADIEDNRTLFQR